MSNDSMLSVLNATPVTMTSREIADLCETRHNQVVETIERLFAKGVLRESRETPRPYSPAGGGRPTDVYDLTKRDTLVVVSGYNEELRARIIDRWMDLEAKANDPARLLTDPAALRTLLLENVEKRIELEAENAELRPAAAALERIAEADGSLCVTDAAKTLQIRPKDLFTFLRSNGWIYRRAGTDTDIAYQSKLITGLLEHKTETVHRHDGTEKVRTQVRVTPKGLTILGKLLPPAVAAA